MKSIAYYNGTTGTPEQMYIPMYDRVCFFGDGVYDACYSRNRKVFTLNEHIDRLFKSAEAVDIIIPLAKNELIGVVEELVKKCNPDEHFVYIQLTRGTGTRSHSFPSTPANLWITVTPKNTTLRSARLKVGTIPDKRYSFCNIKTLNLLPNVLAAQKAQKLGYDEMIFHLNGKVTECAHSNIHLLKNDTLYTSPCDNKILAGIARKHLIAACEKTGIKVVEERFDITSIPLCDELYITSAGTFCSPVSYVDGIPCGGKSQEITTALQDILYSEYINETR